jgi:hypothetical protein
MMNGKQRNGEGMEWKRRKNEEKETNIGYTECNTKVWTNLGYEFHIPKQEKMSMSTCAKKHFIF